MEWLIVIYVLLLVPVCSVAGGLALISTSRRRPLLRPACRACDHSLHEPLDAEFRCPRCGRHLGLAGIRGVYEAGRPIALRVGIATLVFGVLIVLHVLGFIFEFSPI